MRDIAAAQSEAGGDGGADKPRGRRADPNAQSVPSGVPGGLAADAPATNGFGAVKPTSDDRPAGSWDSSGAPRTSGVQHAPQAQPRGSLVGAGGDSITSLLSSMRLGGGDAVHSAPGGLGLDSTWAGAASIDVDSSLNSSSGTSELDSMFDGLMAEQRQLKAERRRSSGVSSAPSSFARGLGSTSANGRWGATQGLGSTHSRRRWGAVPLGTTSNFGPRATRGFANFQSVANNTMASGGYSSPQAGGRYGGYSGYAAGARGGSRRRRTFESIGAPLSPGFGRAAYNQGGFSPMDSMRSGLAGGDGRLPSPVHVSQEAARAHRRSSYQQPPTSQQGQHRAEDYQGFNYGYSSPGHGVHQQPHYGAGQLQQQHTQERYQSSEEETNYYRHEPLEHQHQHQQRQGESRHGDELSQAASSRFLQHGESEHYMNHM